MASIFDTHKNFAYSTVLTAPSPAGSGTTLTVQAGDGAKFPTVPFNIAVWPAGTLPTTANAEVMRVTAISTDTFTVVRTQESSSARNVQVSDQVANAMTVKVFSDIETPLNTTISGVNPGGRLTLITGIPVTTGDVTAATTLYYTPYVGNVIPLPDGSGNWAAIAFSEISIAVPATTSQMYDVFVFNNSGTATLELLAWTNDTKRATAFVLSNGRLVKSGAATRLYVGSFRTTTVSGQTEDSGRLRYVWNYYNRRSRAFLRQESTATWTYTNAVLRQANANTLNQVEAVIGVAEDVVDVRLAAWSQNTNTGVQIINVIGIDSISVAATLNESLYLVSAVNTNQTQLVLYASVPAIGRHFWAWLEASSAVGTTTWIGAGGGGLFGTILA